MASKTAKTVLVGLPVLLVFAFWWVTAPRYVHVPQEAIHEMIECVTLREKYPGKAVYTMDEFRARGEAITACREAKMLYHEANKSESRFGFLLQPPKLLDRAPEIY